MVHMTAAVTACCGADWTLQSAVLDEPLGDEVLVRMVATGICHTDASVRDQHLPVPLPAVLGHEGAGVVEKVGPGVRNLAVGDHVVLCVASCGHCANCLRGLPTYCESCLPLNFSGRRPDGSGTIHIDGAHVSGSFFGQSSFATHALASERNAVSIDRAVPLRLMGPLGCGVQTGAGSVINTLRPRFGSALVVVGAGAVGLSAVMAARLVGCARIVAVDLHENRLALAQELGATEIVRSRPGSGFSEAVRQVLPAGADYVLDTTGASVLLPETIACLAPLGRALFVGVYPPGTKTPLDPNSIFFGNAIGGAVEGDSIPKLFIPQLIEMWKQGRFPFDRMIEFFPFDQINEAMNSALSGRVLKPVLEF